MKKSIIVVSALALLLAMNGAYAKKGGTANGQPFQALWNAIARLEQKINTDTGGTGPQGPQGITGAGNIAFIDDEVTATSTVTAYALTTDGKVWERSTSTWNNMNRNVPTSTSAIAQWELNTLLDKMGAIWHWNGSAWANISHP